MPGFEEYKKKSQLQNVNNNDNLINNVQSPLDSYFEEKKKANLKVDTDNSGRAVVKFDYDADQLMEKFENRNKDADSFFTRTKYYFKDSKVAQAKVERYRRLGEGTDGAIDEYQRHYSYNKANKRKGHATTASSEFAEMKRLMDEYNENGFSLSVLQDIQKKEEIMGHRIKGMCAAAYTKAKSKNHMNYLECRAKLSCYMILKEQIEYLLYDPKQMPRKADRIELKKKLDKIQKNINSAYKGVKKYAPKALDVWREEKGIDSKHLKSRKREYSKKTALVTDKQANLLSHLEMIQDDNAEKEWPYSVVLGDRKRAAINKGEEAENTRNGEYLKALNDAKNKTGAEQEEAKKLVKTMDMEALKRFDKLHVPTPDDLDDTYEYVVNSIKDYYEVFKKALPYYTNGKVPEHVKEYIDEHPQFRAKLEYLQAVDTYIDYYLRSEHMIRYEKRKNKDLKPGKFIIENDKKYRFTPKNGIDGKDGWYREAAFGQGMERENWVKLEKAFSKYGKALKKNAQKNSDQSQSDKNIVNIINNEIDLDNFTLKEKSPNLVTSIFDEEDFKEFKILKDDVSKDKRKKETIPNNANEIKEEKIEENRIIQEDEAEYNKDVISDPNVEKSLEDAYRNLDTLIEGDELTDKEKEEFREITKTRYYVDKDIESSLPKSTYEQLKKNPPAGIDVRGILHLLTPVRLNKYGKPVTDEDAKILEQNKKDCESLCKNSLSARKAFLDRKAMEAKAMMFTPDQLRDHDYIRKNMRRAMRHLTFMHNLKNLFEAHAGYYLNHPSDEVKTIMFGLTTGTDYILYSNYHIQQALFGSNGLPMPWPGGSSAPKAYVSIQTRKGHELRVKDVRKENAKVGGLGYKKATGYASAFYPMYMMRNDPRFDLEGQLKQFETHEYDSNTLGVAANYIFEKEFKTSELTDEREFTILKKYLVPESGKKKAEIQSRMLKVIDEYKTKVPHAHLKNHQGIVEDLVYEKQESISDELKRAKNVTGIKKIKKQDISIIRAYRVIDGLADDEELQIGRQDALKVVGSEVGTNRDMLRFAGPILRVVKYNEKGVFASKLDEDNHKWNKAWFKAVKEKDVNKQKQMVEEEFSQFFKGVTLPKPTELDDWIKNTVYKNPEKYVTIVNKCFYISNMMMANPVVKQYLEDNPVFERMASAYGSLNMFLQSHLKLNVGYTKGLERGSKNTTSDGYFFKSVLDDKRLNNFAVEKEMYQNFYRGGYEGYQKKKSSEDKEYEELSKGAYPQFTKRSYKLRKMLLATKGNVRNVKFVKQIENARKLQRFENNTDATLSRGPSTILRPVKYDGNGKPKTEQDRKNLEWNQKWIDAWEQGDYETREEMIEEELPKYFEGIKKIKFPAPPKDTKPGDTKWMDEYLEKILDEGSEEFLDLILNRYIGISNLKNDHGCVERYLKSHPEIEKVMDCISFFSHVFSAYVLTTYGFSTENDQVEKIDKNVPNPKRLVAYKKSAYNVPLEVYKEQINDLLKSYPDSEFVVGNESKNDNVINFFEEDVRVNKDVIPMKTKEKSLKDAYKNIDKVVDTTKLSDKEKEEVREVTRERYYHNKDMNAAIPLSLYRKLEANKPAGIDVKSIMAVLSPVRIDKYGRPLNIIEERNLQENIETCEKLMTNNLSDRQPFLDGLADKAKKLMYTSEELEDPETIRKDMPRALKHLSFMGAAQKLYKAHAGYFQKLARPDDRAFMFALMSGTNYIAYAQKKIQDALFGKYGLPKQEEFSDELSKEADKLGEGASFVYKKEYGPDQKEEFDKELAIIKKYLEPLRQHKVLWTDETRKLRKKVVVMVGEFNSKVAKEYKDNVKGINDDAIVLENGEELKEEFESLKAFQPKTITRKGYDIMKEEEDALRYRQHPEYISRFNSKNLGSGHSIDRDVNNVMRYVHFDKNWRPVTEEDQKNHQWNLEWLDAWKSDDKQKCEEMMEKQMPDLLKDIELPPMPTEEQIKDPSLYVPVLDKFFDKMTSNKSKLKKMIVCAQKTLAFDQLKNDQAAFATFLKENPKYEALSNAALFINNFFGHYAEMKYSLEISTTGKVNVLGQRTWKYQEDAEKRKQEIEKAHKQYYNGAEANKVAYATILISHLQDYKMHENDKPVPFKRTTK